jgi:hypothetical protein
MHQAFGLPLEFLFPGAVRRSFLPPAVRLATVATQVYFFRVHQSFGTVLSPIDPHVRHAQIAGVGLHLRVFAHFLQRMARVRHTVRDSWSGRATWATSGAGWRCPGGTEELDADDATGEVG